MRVRDEVVGALKRGCDLVLVTTGSEDRRVALIADLYGFVAGQGGRAVIITNKPEDREREEFKDREVALPGYASAHINLIVVKDGDEYTEQEEASVAALIKMAATSTRTVIVARSKPTGECFRRAFLVHSDAGIQYTDGVESGEGCGPIVYHEVTSTDYYIHTKTGGTSKSLRVHYYNDLRCVATEWVAFEATGLGRAKAIRWWKARTEAPVPDTVEDAVDYADLGFLLEPTRIGVQKQGQFDRVVQYELSDHAPGSRSTGEVPF